MNTGKQWVLALIEENDDTLTNAARQIGLSQSTLYKQVMNDAIPPENIVKLADIYQANVLDGLVACGLITEEHIRYAKASAALASATDEELAYQIWRRIADKSKASHPELRGPVTPPSTLYAVDNEDAMEDDDLEWAASPHEETEIPYAE